MEATPSPGGWGGGGGQGGVSHARSLAGSQRSQLTQAGEGEPLGTAQARSPAGKARPRPGLALAALQRSPPAPRRATGLQGVSSKRSSQGTYYRQRRRRVKNSPVPAAAGERRRAADGPYLPPGEPWEGDAPWPGHRIPPLTEPAPRSGPLRTPPAEGAAQRQEIPSTGRFMERS
nr:serine/arginine repetitive matrix protein 3-like [Peromyscus maniculatus bairdii]